VLKGEKKYLVDKERDPWGGNNKKVWIDVWREKFPKG